MNLRQSSSRYGAPVLFLIGLTGTALVLSLIMTDFKANIETWLSAGLVASLILHARTGFAVSRMEQELTWIRQQAQRLPKSPVKVKKLGGGKQLPDVKFKAAKDVGLEDREILGDVKSAIENDRVDLYLQPVANLDDDKTVFFEAFSRLRDANGHILRPVQYIEAAERANRIGVIDNMILLRAIQALREFEKSGEACPVFFNLSPATIFDKGFFSQLIDFLDCNSELAANLIFEFTYPAVEIMAGEIERNLKAIASRGYTFSVDHVRRLDLNWASLREKNFRFVKVPANLLLQRDASDGEIASKILAFDDVVTQNDLVLVVEKVETEADLARLSALGVKLAQGNVFGAPRPAGAFIREPAPLARAS